MQAHPLCSGVPDQGKRSLSSVPGSSLAMPEGQTPGSGAGLSIRCAIGLTCSGRVELANHLSGQYPPGLRLSFSLPAAAF